MVLFAPRSSAVAVHGLIVAVRVTLATDCSCVCRVWTSGLERHHKKKEKKVHLGVRLCSEFSLSFSICIYFFFLIAYVLTRLALYVWF